MGGRRSIFEGVGQGGDPGAHERQFPTLFLPKAMQMGRMAHDAPPGVFS
jgi:hypothetical protein